MVFNSAKCEICLDYFFKPDDVKAFSVRARKPAVVNLGAEAPWSGVRCVCKDCCRFVADLVKFD